MTLFLYFLIGEKEDMICVSKSVFRLACRNLNRNSRKFLDSGHYYRPICSKPIVSKLTDKEYNNTQNHEDFRELFNDSNTERKVKLILMEFALLKQTGNLLVEELEKRDMAKLITIDSPTGRSNYILKYVCTRAKYKLARIRKQEKKRLDREAWNAEKIENEVSENLTYGLNRNCLHFRIRDNTIKAFYMHRLAQAAKFGPRLVFDCSFQDHMSHKECMNAALQLQIAYGLNLVHRTPFDISLCNMNSGDKNNSTFLQCLEKTIPNLRCTTSMLTLCDTNYFDLFPNKRKLVYLSPDAHDVMNKFDSDAVYIIGALVDLGRRVPLTMAKAKQEEIRCMKLPLDSLLWFKPGACKSLPLNQVVQILLELHASGDWTKALGAVAKRAVHTHEEIVARAMDKQKKFSSRSVSSVIISEKNQDVCLRNLTSPKSTKV